MRRTQWKLGLAAAVAIGIALPVGVVAEDGAAALWQGQGQGRGNDDARGNQGRGDDGDRARGNQGRDDDGDRARGNQQERGNADAARGNRQERGNADAARGADARGERGNAMARRRNPARPDAARVRASIDRLPEQARRLAQSDRRSERAAATAVALASLRGVESDRVRIEDGDGWTTVKNSRNEELFRLEDDRELGAWRMRRMGDERPNDESPAFCRSGEGHPVWGREWCIDKGFGLGVNDRSIWSRADDDLGVIFRRDPDANIALDRGGLIDVLGDVVFGRLAVQSLLLGNDEPLAGRWVASSDEPDAPVVLRVTAGDTPIAEFVDDDRDEEVDVLFVSQPRW